MIYDLCYKLLMYQRRVCVSVYLVISFSGSSTLADLLQALEDYLPVLLGLVKDGKTRVRLFVCLLLHDVCTHLRANHLSIFMV